MLNRIFVVLILASVLLAGFNGRMPELGQGILDSAKGAVSLALGLIGAMAFFIGLMKVVEHGGMVRILSRIFGPLLHRLFPTVPPDHPAMSAMMLNMASNMMGLANAATPFGIKAMEELDKLNGRKGTATNAMVLFLAINTAGAAILPTGVIALRSSLGSQSIGGIFVTTWVASGTATIVGVLAALFLSRFYRSSEPPTVDPGPSDAGPATRTAEAELPEPLKPPRHGPFVVCLILAAYLFVLARRIAPFFAAPHVGLPFPMSGMKLLTDVITHWTLPLLVGSMVLFGWVRGVRVYDSLVGAAKEGFQVALRIIPFLVTILVAVGAFRAAGGIDLLVAALEPVTRLIHLPAEALPMALLRPLTGSGAYGVMAEIMSVHGPDTYIGYMVSTFQGSTETTFYVLAVYFGAVGIRRTRHALAACLTADVAGILAAVGIVYLLYG